MNKRKIVDLPGPVSPRRVLERTLDKLDDIDAVYVVIKWSDNRGYDTDWSKLSTGQLCMIGAITQRTVYQHLGDCSQTVRAVYCSSGEPVVDDADDDA